MAAAAQKQQMAELGHKLGQLTQRLVAQLPPNRSALADATEKTPAAHTNIKKRKLLQKVHFGKIYDLAWSANSEQLVTAAQDGKLLVWNGHAQSVVGDRCALMYAVKLKSTWVQAVALSSTHTASGGLDNIVTLHRLNEDALEITVSDAELRGHEAHISSIQYFPGDEKLASTSGDRTCRVWDLASKTCTSVLQGHGQGVTSVSVFNENLLATGSVDGTVKLYDVRAGKCSWTFHGAEADVNAVQFHPSGNAIGGCSEDANCYLWDIRACSPLQVYANEDMDFGAESVCFSKSGRYLFASYQDQGTVYCWDVLKGHIHQQLMGVHSDRVSVVRVAPDGRAIATGSWDHTACLWA